MFNRLLGAFLLILALAGCARPAEVRPAMWLVEGPKGEKAWLFGTIHALPDKVDWRSPTVDAALREADRLVLEVADIGNDAATARIFAGLAQSPGLQPLESRIPADLRDELTDSLQDGGMNPGALDAHETWAAALMLQSAGAAASQNNSANGIDRAVARAWSGPVEEFEGAAAQLSLFDRLPEAQQRALLDAVLMESGKRDVQLRELQQAWARGDMALIARVTDEGFAEQPALREALLSGRNRAWAERLDAMLRSGARPFVAVGAAHLAGTDNLPDLLAARGWKVTRVQ